MSGLSPRKLLKGRSLRILVFSAVSLGLVLLYLLATETPQTSDVFNELPMLLGAGILLIVLLIILVGAQLNYLRRRLKAKVFGSKLTARLVLVFTLVAIVPGAVMYGISVKFLAGSMQSWFDVRVDNALEGGLNLGRANLENGLRELKQKAESMAVSLSLETPASRLATLYNLREQAAIHEATLFSSGGEVLAHAAEDDELVPSAPSQTILRNVRVQQSYSVIEEDALARMVLKVILPVYTLDEELEVFLQVSQFVPENLARDAVLVQEAYRDYQELSLSRYGLQRLYNIALALSLGLALFSVILLAVMFSNRLSAPLGFLEAGTRAVAQGDFSQRQPINRQDELGVLTESFSTMTRQLAEAKASAQGHEAALTHANAYLENILANLSAGVLSFNADFSLQAFNSSAEKILGRSPEGELSNKPENIEDKILRRVKLLVETHFSELAESSWEEQVELDDGTNKKMISFRGSRSDEGGEPGYLIVFDDVTNLLRAERYALWGEVAQRLAHEIKNPLTPIQLSAERLSHKLRDKLGVDDAKILDRSTGTIVDQVAALKTMVNAFNEYSRNPAKISKPVDINLLVADIEELYRASRAEIVVSLAPDLPRVMGDSGKLRQLLHNLIQNAEQATEGVTKPKIVIETELKNDMVCVKVQDNGPGFPDTLISRAFDPYVTSKAKGTGLGLAIVKKIIEEHAGEVDIVNTSNGALVEVMFSNLTQAQNEKNLRETG